MIFETYSARLKKAQRGDEPDVYQYSVAPKFMRQQIAAAIKEGIGPYLPHRERGFVTNHLWEEIARICAKEVEMFVDYAIKSRADVRLIDRLISLNEIEPFLDIVEISCRMMLRLRKDAYKYRDARIGLFTHAFDKSFNSFIAMMKTGLPSIRNDAGAHGESLEANAVTSEIARYAINMTATNILFLAECHERFRQAHPH